MIIYDIIITLSTPIRYVASRVTPYESEPSLLADAISKSRTCAHFSLLEIPIDTDGCTISSECDTIDAICSSQVCRCPDIKFYNGTHCLFSKLIHHYSPITESFSSHLGYYF